MSRKRRKKHSYVDPELNIMPFIDVFGLLTTYLLFSAVFVSIGILEVQVPFISNASPPPTEAQRNLEIKVDVGLEKILLTTSWTQPPENEEKHEYTMTEDGVGNLHRKLVELKTQNAKVEIVTLFTDDEVKYNELIKVIDSIKLRWENDGSIATDSNDTVHLFPKVVMGSVIL